MAQDVIDSNEIKLPKGSTFGIDEKGNIVGNIKPDRKDKKEEERDRKERELLSEWSAVAGQPEEVKHIVVKKRLDATEGGNNEAQVMTLNLSDFIDETGGIKQDLEEYLKDRMERGTYVCRVRVNYKLNPKCPPYYFTFIEDGKLWKKKREEESGNDDNFSGLNRGFRGGNRESIDPHAIVNSIERAVQVGKEAASDSGSEEKASIISSLTNALIKKDDGKKEDSVMPVVLELIRSASAPRQDPNSAMLVEVVKSVLAPKQDTGIMQAVMELGRGMSESVKELGRMVTESNNRISEMQIKSIEERSKDKMELLKLIQEIKTDNKGGGATEILETIKPMMEVSKIMSGFMMTSFKDMIEMRRMSDGGSQGEEKETIGEKLLNGVLGVGGKIVEGYMARQPGLLPPMPDGSDKANTETLENDEGKEEDVEGVTNEKELINNVVSIISSGIKSKSEDGAIVELIAEKYSGEIDLISEILSRKQEQIEVLLTPISKGRIFANMSRMKTVIELFKKKYLQQT